MSKLPGGTTHSQSAFYLLPGTYLKTNRAVFWRCLTAGLNRLRMTRFSGLADRKLSNNAQSTEAA